MLNPGFVESPVFQLIDTGGEATMSCLTSGGYPTSISWYKDDNIVSLLVMK